SEIWIIFNPSKAEGRFSKLRFTFLTLYLYAPSIIPYIIEKKGMAPITKPILARNSKREMPPEAFGEGDLERRSLIVLPVQRKSLSISSTNRKRTTNNFEK